MGREIRKVPKGWEHPAPRPHGRFHPMRNRSFTDALVEWTAGEKSWAAGTRPEYAAMCDDYEEWAGPPPDPAYHRPAWPEESRTHFQIYETVSEGTPRSPVFETLAEMVEWMIQPIDRKRWPEYNYGADWQCSQGYTQEQAEAFVGAGWSVSLVISSGRRTSGIATAELGVTK